MMTSKFVNNSHSELYTIQTVLTLALFCSLTISGLAPR